MRSPFNKIAAQLVMASMASLLVACGGGGSGDASSGEKAQADTKAPSAEIMFPTPVAMTESDSVLVRGTANDQSKIASVKVNGIEAITSDSYATWQARVPLIPGENLLTVATVDSAQNKENNAATASIKRTSLLLSPRGIAIDQRRNRALVTTEDSIIAVDLQSGARSLFSGSAKPDAENAFSNLQAIAVDSDHDRALVIDSGLPALIAVDLTSGARTIISSEDLSLTSLGWGPKSLVIDNRQNRVLIWGSDVIAVDLTTGIPTQLDYGAFILSNSMSIVLSRHSNELLPVNYQDPEMTYEVMDKNYLYNTCKPDPYRNSRFIAIDKDHNRAFLANDELTSVQKMDLTTGQCSSFAKNLVVSGDEFPWHDSQVGIAIDTAHNRILATDKIQGAIVALDLTTGARSILSDNSTANIDNSFYSPEEFLIDPARNRAIVVDTFRKAIMTMDLESGARSILTDISMPDTSSLQMYVRGMAFDSASNSALMGDQKSQFIIEMNVATGEHKVLPNSLPFEIMPCDLALDQARNRAIIVDCGNNAVGALDLKSGKASVLSEPDTIDDNNFLPRRLALDTKRNRALVLHDDCNYGAGQCNDYIAAIDLSNGSKKIFSPDAAQDAIAQHLRFENITFDRTHDRAFAITRSNVFSIDASNGTRTLLSGATKTDIHNYLTRAIDIVVDEAHSRALITDDYLKAVIAVDLITGEQVIFSR